MSSLRLFNRATSMDNQCQSQNPKVWKFEFLIVETAIETHFCFTNLYLLFWVSSNVELNKYFDIESCCRLNCPLSDSSSQHPQSIFTSNQAAIEKTGVPKWSASVYFITSWKGFSLLNSFYSLFISMEYSFQKVHLALKNQQSLHQVREERKIIIKEQFILHKRWFKLHLFCFDESSDSKTAK